MSPPVLAYKTDRTSRFRGQNKSYLLGGIQFVPSPRNAFAAADTLSVFFQLRNVPAELRAGGAIQYAFDRQTETMKLPERGRVIYRTFGDIADLGQHHRAVPPGGNGPLALFDRRGGPGRVQGEGKSSKPRSISTFGRDFAQ